MTNSNLDDEFSKVYQENYIADSSKEQVIYVDKLTGKEKAEPGYLPLETGYPEGIEPGSEEAITYDIRRIRIHGFPQNYLDAEHLEQVNKMKEGSQITDPAWITASKIMYHYLETSDITLAKNMIGNQDPETEGGQGPKSDKEYAEWGRDWMGSFLNNISYMSIDAVKMSDAPIDVSKAMYYLLETADRDGVLLRNFKNGLYYTSQDVSNYVGLATLGLALIPKFLGKQATKKAIKQSLFRKIVSATTSPTAALVGVESGSYFALEDGIRQKVKMDADLQEEFNYLQNSGAFATGTIFGNTLTKGLEVAAPVVKKGIDKVGNALKKPEINTQSQTEIDLVPDTSLENVPQETTTKVEPTANTTTTKDDFTDVTYEMAPQDGKYYNKVPPDLSIKNDATEKKPVFPVTQAFIPTNKEKNFTNMDLALENNKNAMSSPEAWNKFQNEAIGGEYLPFPPMKALEYFNNPDKMVEKIRTGLTPELKEGVDRGYKFVKDIKGIYESGKADPKMTADLFIWGILSRGKGPYQQEGAFIDIIDKAGPLVQKAVNGNFTEADLVTWNKTISAVIPEGSPGKQSTDNTNAAGKMLLQLSKKVPGTNDSVIVHMHKLMTDPNISAAKVRREFMNLTDRAGIDNKVVSFTLLVGGKDDVLVLDRIQGRHLWDDGRFDGFNIYDGYAKEGTTIKSGIVGVLRGPRGILYTEALENGLRDKIKEVYTKLGRPEDGTIGRWHWENWVIEGDQVVDHSTLKYFTEGSTKDLEVKEMKRNMMEGGATYRKVGDGETVVDFPLSDGSKVTFTPTGFKDFLEIVRKPKSGILPKGFKVKFPKEKGLWYEQPGIDRQKLDQLAREQQDKGNISTGTTRPGEGTNTNEQRSGSGGTTGRVNTTTEGGS
tara:strand:+ start:6021 stop:8684 length:2664 start_codon:yes stop_codon:yes gene_type:complete